MDVFPTVSQVSGFALIFYVLRFRKKSGFLRNQGKVQVCFEIYGLQALWQTLIISFHCLWDLVSDLYSLYAGTMEDESYENTIVNG